MLKKILSLLKKIVFTCFLLYGYNLIAAPIKLIIPINFITVGAITIFGVPALLSFIIIFLISF